MFETNQCFNRQPIIFSLPITKTIPHSVLNHEHIEDHELAMNNSTNTSIAIGAASAGDGEMVIGNDQNHDTLKIDVSTQHKVNVAGSTKFAVHDTYAYFKTGLRVLGMLTGLTGYALLPNSYHISNSYASKVQMFVLDPSMLMIDSSVSQVIHAPASLDTVSPVQQTVDPSMVLGARSSSGNNESYIYISPSLVPPGWKLIKYQVNWSLRAQHDDTTSPAPSLWSGQTGFYVRKIKNNNGNLIGTYVQEHFKSGATDGTNVLNELKVEVH